MRLLATAHAEKKKIQDHFLDFIDSSAAEAEVAMSAADLASSWAAFNNTESFRTTSCSHSSLRRHASSKSHLFVPRPFSGIVGLFFVQPLLFPKRFGDMRPPPSPKKVPGPHDPSKNSDAAERWGVPAPLLSGNCFPNKSVLFSMAEVERQSPQAFSWGHDINCFWGYPVRTWGCFLSPTTWVTLSIVKQRGQCSKPCWSLHSST